MNEFFTKYRKELIHNLFLCEDIDFIIKYKNKDIITNLEKIKRNIEEKITSQKIFFSKAEESEELKKDFIKRLDNFRNYAYGEPKSFIDEKDIDTIINIGHKNTWIYLAKNQNKNIWTDEFIDKYYKKWDQDSWTYMSENINILWSKNRIVKYSDHLNFKALSNNPTIEIDYQLFEMFYDKWSVVKLSSHPIIAKDPKLENAVLEHKDALWYDKEQRLLYFPEKFKNVGICSNTAIYWTLDKYEKYREKIDIWLLAKFGKLSNELLFKYGYLLNENRFIKNQSVKSSDWYDSYSIYINGWENLMDNENQDIDFELINFLSKQTFNKIDAEGDARGGFSHYEKNKSVLSAIDKLSIHDRIKINFEDFIKLNHEEIIDYFIFKDYSFPQGIFNKIIKKGFMENQETFKKYLNLVFISNGRVYI